MPTSIMSLHRIRASLHLASFFKNYAERLGTKLMDVLRECLEPGERMPDLVLFLRLLGRYLDRARERLREADWRNDKALEALTAARDRRDGVARRVRKAFVGLRDTVSVHHGEKGLFAADLKGRGLRKPFDLWQRVVNVLEAVAKPRFRMPPPLLGRVVTGTEIREILADDTEELGTSLTAVDDAQHDLDVTRVERKSLRKKLDTTYVQLGGLARAVCGLLDEPLLAERTHKALRDVVSRGGGAKEPASDDEAEK